VGKAINKSGQMLEDRKIFEKKKRQGGDRGVTKKKGGESGLECVCSHETVQSKKKGGVKKKQRKGRGRKRGRK